MAMSWRFRDLALTSGARINEFSTDGTLSGNSDIAVPTEKAVKEYVDAGGRTLQWKQSVKCATIGNGTFSTAYANGQTVDGITLVTGDRILLKDQTAGEKNGIYIVAASGAPTRATDMDVASEFYGSVVTVERGTVNADSTWICTNDAITLETTPVVFSIFGGIKAGTNMAFDADVLSFSMAAMTASNLVRVNAAGTAVEVSGILSADVSDAVSKKHTQGSDPLEEVMAFPMSFETGEQMTLKVYFPYKVTINKIRSIVTKALAGTDDGTITCGNSTGASTGGVVTVATSAALADEDSATPSDNNVVLADGYYYLTTAKSTAGGKVLVTLEFTRTA